MYMKFLNRLVNLTILLAIAAVVFFFQYLLFVPFNFHSFGFIFELSILLVLLVWLFVRLRKGKNKEAGIEPIVYVAVAMAVLMLIGAIVGGPYTGGLKNYKNQSVIKEIDFETIPEFDVTQVQLVDKNTAQQLGDRVFGTLGSDEVSQYAVGDDWVQICVNGTLYRVTPIDFGSFLKYMATGSTPGYIMVDCESGDAKLVRTEGMKYMTTAYFGHNLYRHLFFKDPTALLGTAKFELDDSYQPYWVVPVYKMTWLDKTEDIKGVYVVDPFNGDATYYDVASVPAWVDNVYPVSVVYRQFSQSKKYENGLFNWSKKGVVEFTDDYAYVQFNDNVWIYTGVTSVGKDESNVGFAYIDLRNKEISYIRRAGAEEYSARSSAEGAVQQYHYTAIFPSMVSVKGRPTYFMGLVDGANLIKNYAFVSYENYQTAATGATVQEAYDSYLKLIGETQKDTESETVSFEVKDLQSYVKDGNTVILYMNENKEIYWYDLSNGDLSASFIQIGDTITVKVKADKEIIEFVQN